MAKDRTSDEQKSAGGIAVGEPNHLGLTNANGEGQEAMAGPDPTRSLSPHERQRIQRKRHLFYAVLLTAIFVSIVVWTSFRPTGEGNTLAIAPTVVFEDMCARVRKEKLDKLHVTEFEVTDAMIPQIVDLDSIETLIFDRGVLTDESINSIVALPNLRHLRLRMSPISDEGLKTLAQSESLWYLNLPHVQCTAEGIASLSQMRRLRQLRLGSDVLGNDVASAIASIESLRGIHLIGIAITDEGLQELAAMPNLESLYLDDAKVTEAGWEWLFKNYSELHVHRNQTHHDRDPKAHAHHE